jgi:hypothetical protein
LHDGASACYSVWVPTSLERALATIANTFVQRVLAAVRASSIDAVVALPDTCEVTTAVSHRRRGRERVAARSAEDIERIVDQILEVLRARGALLGEELGVELGLRRSELARPIAKAISDRKVAKRGAGRSATYVLSEL